MDNIKFNFDFIEIVYYGAHILETIEELKLKEENIDWETTIKNLKKVIKKEIKWVMSEYSKDWLEDSIVEKGDGK